jgi:hypothetical protein
MGYKSYYMPGLSRGGWKNAVYAGIDPRIRGSFPVLGSLPFWARMPPELAENFEQIYLGLYQIANYLDFDIWRIRRSLFSGANV